VDLGFVRPASQGTFAYLNLALRSLEKLTALADVVMEEAGCQKILLPSLVTLQYNTNSK
jgi:prolyl-tRNA synthetase